MWLVQTKWGSGGEGASRKISYRRPERREVSGTIAVWALSGTVEGRWRELKHRGVDGLIVGRVCERR